MSNILSEISRVREIMGVLKEQSNEEQVLDADVITPSEEILAWAEDQISWRQGVIDDGVEEDGNTQADLDEYADDILELQQDPVLVLHEAKEQYCKWVEEGDNDWVDECQETTELLATLSSEDPITGTTVTPTGTTVTPTGTTVTQNNKVEAFVELKGCTDPKFKEYKKKYTKDDGSCKTLKRKYRNKGYEPVSSADDMAKELKTAWKKEVFKVLESINSGDVFGFNEAYSLQKTDKLHALLKILQNIMCINAKIARTAILTKDNVYDSSKLMDTAIMPVGSGHEGLINTIENNIEIVDDKFKLFRGGMKVDRKLKPIRKQLKQARNFINELVPYINWNETKDILGFDARRTEDILLNSKNLRKLHTDCANQLGTR